MIKTRQQDIDAMSKLLEILNSSSQTTDVPVAAAIYDKQMNLVCSSTNKREMTNDPTAHAEIHVLSEAGQKKNTWNLQEFTLFVTLEPCLMCAGAILQSRISKVVFGAYNPGNISQSTYPLLRENNPQLEVVGGVLNQECSEKLSTWFSNQRLLKG